ncbi:CoA ester lyase [Baekduia soli]|uniref:CoA ester lyase n=1 Tax=Baekduia soli TaxID=496014 RepID=A0A5B8UA64_9ACTN|nr:CoA ester lyase [Baekduia soli]QEC49708.1 CoA ester lyase [Baekduia soli]
MIAPLRSLLFAPGDDPRKLGKALASEADVVVADLEDAVAPEAKEGARATIEEAFRAAGDRRGAIVRVNALETPWAQDDLAWARRLGVGAVLVPKATPEALAALPGDLPPVIAILETALGVHRAFDVASHPAVRVLLLGALDLSAEIDFRWTASGEGLLFARSKLVLESAAAGIDPPLDTVWVQFADHDGLREESENVRGLGFQGKCCIHPAQVAIVNAAFSNAEQVAWARRVVEAYDAALARGDGAIAVDGEMIDMASLRRARELLRRAGPAVPEDAGGT